MLTNVSECQETHVPYLLEGLARSYKSGPLRPIALEKEVVFGLDVGAIVLLSIFPVLEPECEPTQSDHEEHIADQVAETEGFAVSVAKIVQNLSLSQSSLRYLCHEDFSTELHR